MQIWHYWYLLSALLFLLEAAAIPGIGFFFAAIGALSVGLLVQWDIIGASWLAQTTAFFFLTGLWTVLLWKPLQKLRPSKFAQDKHHDIIGRKAIVGPEGLVKGKRGHATWSGTLMSARLADDANEDAPAGAEMKIVDLEGSTLVLKDK